MLSALTVVEDAAAIRERLILEHLPQVQLLAKRLHASFNGRVDIKDLISIGTIGLIAAVDHFEPSRGTKLKTYAEFKIRGAMLDSIAAFTLDGRGREQRKMWREIDAAAQQLQQHHQRTATQEEIAESMGLSLLQLHRCLESCAAGGFVPLQHPRDDSRGRPLTTTAPSPEREAQLAELCDLVNSAIETLDPEEIQLLNLFYRDELSLAEISEIMGKAEWRLMRMKREALIRLRERLSLTCADEFEAGMRPPQTAVFSVPLRAE